MNAPKNAAAKPGEDFVTGALKKRYFDVIEKENYPHTPELTREADNLETAIRQMSGKSEVGNAT